MQDAKKAGKIDWTTGAPFKVSRAYVNKFIDSRDELRQYKASHIDPVRAKKATPQVRRSRIPTRLFFCPCPCFSKTKLFSRHWRRNLFIPRGQPGADK